MSLDFHFLVPESFHKKLVQIGKVVSEKIQFEFVYVHYLGTRSSNYHDLQYSHTFIYSIRCLLLPCFRALAAIVSEKSIVFTFSYRKTYVTKFDLAVKTVKVTPGSLFSQFLMGWSPLCYIPSFTKIGPPDLGGGGGIFEEFYHIWAWRPSWSFDQHHVIRFSFLCT